MDLQEEQALIEETKQNPQVFGKIFDEYYGPLYGYVLKRVGAVAIAEDIVSEVFYKAVKALPSFTWQNISISSWLYKIAVNEIRLWFRNKYNVHWSIEYLQQESGFDVVSAKTIETEIIELQDEYEQSELGKAVQAYIKLLPLKYQEVVTLRFFEEKTTPEIASILDKREGTVRSLLSRGITKLQIMFQHDEKIPERNKPSQLVL